MIIRLCLLLCVTCLAGSCATRQEFKRVDPTRIAVVIGYEVVGATAIHPALSSTLGTAILLAGAPSFASVLLSSITEHSLNILTRTDHGEVTMVDELNDSVYRSIEATLSGKGYEVSLVKAVPIAFDWWEDDGTNDAYYQHIGDYYQLDEPSLLALDADAVLYVEYRITARIEDTDDLQSIAAVDLRFGEIRKTARAFSLPPDNKMIFDGTRHFPLSGRWIPFEAALRRIAYVESWQDKAARR